MQCLQNACKAFSLTNHVAMGGKKCCANFHPLPPQGEKRFVCVALKQIWITAVYCFLNDTQLTSSELHIQVDSFHVLKVSVVPQLLLNLAGSCCPFYCDPLGTNAFLDRFFSDPHTLQALTFLS